MSQAHVGRVGDLEWQWQAYEFNKLQCSVSVVHGIASASAFIADSILGRSWLDRQPGARRRFFGERAEASRSDAVALRHCRLERVDHVV